MQIIDVTDSCGCIVETQWMLRAESVHRQLREALPQDYAIRLGQVFSAGGRMTIAAEGDAVLALAVWRIIENTADGRRFFIDDLVTDQACRSRGLGGEFLRALEQKARDLRCNVVALDSGTQRSGAHKFYFRAGYTIPAFSFRKAIK